MRKFGSQIAAAYYLIKYIILSRHWKGHGIHSPYVFDFVSKILFDKTNFSEYQYFDSIIASLKASKEKLQVEDLGDKSSRFKKKFREVRELLKISSISKKYGRLLFRIVSYYKPAVIVELGTSIGLSAIYLAKGNSESKILTIEGNKDLCDYASAMFETNGLKNVNAVMGDFDQVLENLPSEYSTPQFVFIDGNHKYEPTIRYYKHFFERMNEGIIIIDDIYWSAGMRKVWKEIVQQNKENVTIDLYRMGIVLIRESITSGHYVVRY